MSLWEDCRLQFQIQIHHSKFRFTTANSDSPRQVQIHCDKFKFDAENSTVACKCHGKTLQEQESKNFHCKSFQKNCKRSQIFLQTPQSELLQMPKQVLENNRAKSFAKTKAKLFTNITAKVFANTTAKVFSKHCGKCFSKYHGKSFRKHCGKSLPKHSGKSYGNFTAKARYLLPEVHCAAAVNITLGDQGLSRSKFCKVRSDFKLSAHQVELTSRYWRVDCKPVASWRKLTLHNVGSVLRWTFVQNLCTHEMIKGYLSWLKMHHDGLFWLEVEGCLGEALVSLLRGDQWPLKLWMVLWWHLELILLHLKFFATCQISNLACPVYDQGSIPVVGHFESSHLLQIFVSCSAVNCNVWGDLSWVRVAA